MVPKRGPLVTPLNVLWLIDHVCYDGSLHGGGRLYMNVMPRFDPTRVRIHPFFLRASPEVQELFRREGGPVVNLDKGRYDPTSLNTVARLCRELDIDVMHLFCYASSTFGRIVGALRGIPTIVHDFDTQVYFPYPLYLRVLDRALARSTCHALAASSFCRDYMCEVRRVPRGRVDILYHTIPEPVLDGAENANSAAERSRLGWPADAFVIGCITKLGPERGNDTLLTAFRRVADRLPKARLALVYKPTLYHRVPGAYADIPWIRDVDAMRERVDRQVAELNLGNRVELVEAKGSMLPYYAASDVLVAPFENARFSSVHLVEGLAHGKPFIGSDLGEPREIGLAHGVGKLVPPGDADALSAAMIEVAEQPDLLREMGRRARAASRHFTVEATTDRLSSLYEGLASHRPTPVVSRAI